MFLGHELKKLRLMSMLQIPVKIMYECCKMYENTKCSVQTLTSLGLGDLTMKTGAPIRPHCAHGTWDAVG